jgi:hypothetical protein
VAVLAVAVVAANTMHDSTIGVTWIIHETSKTDSTSALHWQDAAREQCFGAEMPWCAIENRVYAL